MRDFRMQLACCEKYAAKRRRKRDGSAYRITLRSPVEGAYELSETMNRYSSRSSYRSHERLPANVNMSTDRVRVGVVDSIVMRDHPGRAHVDTTAHQQGGPRLSGRWNEFPFSSEKSDNAIPLVYLEEKKMMMSSDRWHVTSIEVSMLGRRGDSP